MSRKNFVPCASGQSCGPGRGSIGSLTASIPLHRLSCHGSLVEDAAGPLPADRDISLHSGSFQRAFSLGRVTSHPDCLPWLSSPSSPQLTAWHTSSTVRIELAIRTFDHTSTYTEHTATFTHPR